MKTPSLKTLLSLTALAPAFAFAEMQPQTYVRPEGENTPAEPYDTWETAANDIRTAADITATNGVIDVKSGSYTSSYFLPKHAVELRAVTGDDPAAPGVVSFASSPFGYGYSDQSDDIHKMTLSYGTFAGIPSSGNFFTDGLKYGSGGSRPNFKFVISGEGTYLDMSAASFYIGWSLHGTTVRYTNKAGGYHKNTFVGLSGNCTYSTL